MSDQNEKKKPIDATRDQSVSGYVVQRPQLRQAVKPPAPVKPDPLKLTVAMEGFTYGIPRGKNKI